MSDVFFLDTLRSVLPPVGPSERSSFFLSDNVLKPAAVLVLLFPRDGNLRFFLIVRPETMRRHPGQIGLPGGKHESTDRNLWETAIRETQEELGIDPHDVHPLGRLESVPVTVAGYIIYPFVGWRASPPEVIPDHVEVADVLEVRLGDLLDPKALEDGVWEYRDTQWHVSFYRLAGRTIWGATARVLGQLVLALRDPTPAERLVVPGSIRPA